MTRSPRFEIVRSDSGHHVRYIGGNGKSVFTTESNGYRREGTAIAAIETFTGYPVKVQPGSNGEALEVFKHDRDELLVLLEVRRVDERTSR